MFMNRYLAIVLFIMVAIFCGATAQKLAQKREECGKTRPFAQLYGNRQARWLDMWESSNFGCEQRNIADFNDLEISEFSRLDLENQLLYLKSRLCKSIAGSAEQGSQIYRLIAIVRKQHPECNAYKSLKQQNPSAIDRYAKAVNFGGSAAIYFQQVEVFLAPK